MKKTTNDLVINTAGGSHSCRYVSALHTPLCTIEGSTGAIGDRWRGL